MINDLLVIEDHKANAVSAEEIGEGAYKVLFKTHFWAKMAYKVCGQGQRLVSCKGLIPDGEYGVNRPEARKKYLVFYNIHRDIKEPTYVDNDFSSLAR